MKTGKHRILDHPVLGYFLLIIFTIILSGICSLIIDNGIFALLIPGYAITMTARGSKILEATGPGAAAGALAAIGIFYLRFRPSFDGILKKKDIFKGLIMLSPVLIIHWAGSVVSWIGFGTANVLFAFLRALAPGFSEETAFRGPGVANYLRRIPTEKGVVTIFWLSSVIFGLMHMTNALLGAPLWITIGQSAYAVGIGMALCAVYLRTGNLWPSILAHTSLDFMELIRADLGSSGGLMSVMGMGDWITIVAGVIGGVLGLYLIRPSKRGEIVELWIKKWTQEDQVTEESL